MSKRIAYVTYPNRLSMEEVTRLREQWDAVHSRADVEAPQLVILDGASSFVLGDDDDRDDAGGAVSACQ